MELVQGKGLLAAACFLGVATMAAVPASLPAAAVERFSKDAGPTGGCDGLAKGSDAFTACVAAAKASATDTDLFYAGYWLAKSGKYDEALKYLKLVAVKDERVITYIGYATRKLGQVDAALPLYRQALEINPNYVVARAYLGEAFLTKGQPEAAKDQLAEIAERCGATCPEYIDLATSLSAYVAQKG